MRSTRVLMQSDAPPAHTWAAKGPGQWPPVRRGGSIAMNYEHKYCAPSLRHLYNSHNNGRTPKRAS